MHYSYDELLIKGRHIIFECRLLINGPTWPSTYVEQLFCLVVENFKSKVKLLHVIVYCHFESASKKNFIYIDMIIECGGLS